MSAALYIDQAQKLQVQGGILLDGTKTAASAEANKASFADGSLLIVNGSGIGTSGTAALTGGSGSTLTVNQGAKLYLTSTNAGLIRSPKVLPILRLMAGPGQQMLQLLMSV